MKGTIFNIQKYSIQDGPGIRTIVFLKGCPLHCEWCSNPESQNPSVQMAFQRKLCIDCGACVRLCPENAISQDEKYGKYVDENLCRHCGICESNCPAGSWKQIGYEMTVDEVISEIEKDRIFYRKSNGGVTLSGGEPFAQPAFAAELLKKMKEIRLHTAVETAGYVPFSVYEKCLGDIDLFLYDIKHIDSRIHREHTKATNERILNNLQRLDDYGKKIWIRIPLIPGVNDSCENIQKTFALAEKLKTVERVELLPYHDYGVGKYEQLGMEYKLKDMITPSEKKLDELIHFVQNEFPKVKCVIRRH